MIEKIKEARDKHKVRTATLTDPSNIFGCLNHDLFIARLYAFGFN